MGEKNLGCGGKVGEDFGVEFGLDGVDSVLSLSYNDVKGLRGMDLPELDTSALFDVANHVLLLRLEECDACA